MKIFSKNWIYVIILLIISTIVFIFNINAYMLQALWPDVQTYQSIAKNIGLNPFNTEFREPLWIWIIKLSEFFLGKEEFIIRSTSYLFYIITCLLFFLLCNKIINSRFISFFFTCILIFYPHLNVIGFSGIRDNGINVIIITYIYLYYSYPFHKIKFFLITLTCMAVLIKANLFMSFLSINIIIFFFKKDYKFLLYSFLSSFLFLLIIIFYQYIKFDDPFYSTNVHTIWARNYEFCYLERLYYEFCASKEMLSQNMYSGPEVTAFEYLFEYRPFSDLIYQTIYGYFFIYVNKIYTHAYSFSYLIQTKFYYNIHFISLLFTFSVISIQILGIARFLIKKHFLILLIPILISNFSVILTAPPMQIDYRIFSYFYYFQFAYMAYGLVYFIKLIKLNIFKGSF